MSSSILLEREEQKEEEQGIPVCGANLSSPVVDQNNAIPSSKSFWSIYRNVKKKTK